MMIETLQAIPLLRIFSIDCAPLCMRVSKAAASGTRRGRAVPAFTFR